MTKGDDAGLEAFLKGLDDGRVVYFPIRHHSPACAWHLVRVIRERRPASILIEGPESLTGMIGALGDDELVAPVALYTLFIDRKRRTVSGDDGGADRPVPRFGAYYPLCDYSPELVAIREGAAVAAKVGFCDLDHHAQVLCEQDPGGHSQSMFDEAHLLQSRYLQELAQRRGCRDSHELWDRLIECDFRGEETEALMKKVAAYCFFARVHTSPEMLETDGTLAREACMAAHVERERRRLRRKKEERPLLVVTGGFHTPALVAGKCGAEPEAREVGEDEVLQALIPYSYEQLDGLHGYASGMPSPGYYQRLWQAEGTGAEALEEISRALLVEVPACLREAGAAVSVSTADVIAAHHQACQLARFRGNPGPLREDVIDGVRSSFVKGELDAEGRVVLGVLNALMTGNAVGELPARLIERPILADFRRQATELGLKLDGGERGLVLEVYKRSKHRRVSRFLHCLDFIAVPYGRFTQGPDFLTGHGLELQNEQWSCHWSPQTEAALVDASILGGTVADAVLGKLHEQELEMERKGGEVGADEAVGLLLRCCQLGLHGEAGRFLPMARRKLEGESDFVRCLQAGLRLGLFRRFPGPLEASRLAGAAELVEDAYVRLCFLAGALDKLPDESQQAAAEALAMVRDLIAPGAGLELDADLFFAAAERVERVSTLDAELAGALAGFLFSEGRLDDEELLGRIEGQALSGDERGPSFSRYLLGLFSLCRELTWQNEGLMERIDQVIAGWDEEEFLRALPHLRLAFSHHTPRETDDAGRLVASLHGEKEGLDWYQRDLEEGFVTANAARMALLRRSLERDGLLSYVGDED